MLSGLLLVVLGQLLDPIGTDKGGAVEYGDQNVALRVCNGTCPPQLQGSLGEGITFSRASAWTCPNDDGTIQTLASGAPCISAASMTTNILRRSQAFATAPWNAFGSGSVAPTVTNNTGDLNAPDGTATATKIVYPVTSGSNVSIAYNGTTFPTNGTFVFSVYLRTLSGTALVYIEWQDGFVFVSRACALTTSWSRCSIATVPTAGMSPSIGVDLRDGTQSAQPAQTVYGWGAQVESGSQPTGYVPTTSPGTIGGGTPYGVKVRAATTNKLQFSSSIGTAPWNTFNLVCALPTLTLASTDLPDPTGGNAATKVVFPACTGAGHDSLVFQTFTATAAAWSTGVYARTLSGSYTFNVELALVSAGAPTMTCNATSTQWTRCSVNNATATAASWNTYIGYDGNNGGQTPISAGTVYLYGAQANLGPAVADLCQTVGAAATCLVEAAATTVAPSVTETNQLQYSSSIGTAPWALYGNGCATPALTLGSSDLLDPAGGNAATKVVFPSCVTGNSSYVYQAYTSTAAQWSAGVYARTLSGSYTFNFEIVYAGGPSTGATMRCTATSTNWTFCSLPNVTGTAQGWQADFGIDQYNPSSTTISAGTVYLWGAQANLGAVVGPLCQSTGAPATCVTSGLGTSFCTSADVVSGLDTSLAQIVMGTGSYSSSNTWLVLFNGPTIFEFRAYDNTPTIEYWRATIAETASTAYHVRICYDGAGGTPLMWLNGAAQTLSVGGAGTGILASSTTVDLLSTSGNSLPFTGTGSNLCFGSCSGSIAACTVCP